MGAQPIQVLLVEDHAMVRKGIKALLNEYKGISVIGEATNGLVAIELVKRFKPDVVLIDLLMPGMDGIEAIQRIIAIQSDQRIIALTGYLGDDKLFSVIEAGALGYLNKDVQADELVQSIRDVYAGKPSIDLTMAWRFLSKMAGIETTANRSADELSEREIQVLRLLSQGKTDQEIAEELVLTKVTIRMHMSRIFSKLGLQNRVQAVLYSIRSGMVSLSETNNMNEVHEEYTDCLSRAD